MEPPLPPVDVLPEPTDPADPPEPLLPPLRIRTIRNQIMIVNSAGSERREPEQRRHSKTRPVHH
jgi:hypothetical protein